jgi:endonuclease/exonuclease/phosphatase family metal-dependent hydrolase
MKRTLMVVTMGLLASAGLTACNFNPAGVDLNIDLSGGGPHWDPPKADSGFVHVPARVVTWNVYMGADLEPLFNASSEAEVPALTADYWSAVQATDFRDRAEAIAMAVAGATPDAIALQEVMLFRTQSPGDATTDTPTAAQDTALDFLAILKDALNTDGLDYRVVAESDNFDIEVPMAVNGGLVDLRITDRDVILARGDHELKAAASGPFQVNRTVQVGQASFVLTRGWAYADLILSQSGNTFEQMRFATTRLESDAFPDVQTAQAEELLKRVWPAGSSSWGALPTLLAGDLESPPDSASTTGFQVLWDAGLRDAWTLGPSEAGFTCCHALTLDDDAPLSRRVDYIFAASSNTYGTPVAPTFNTVRIVGADYAGHTAAGRWASTHAGLFASIW